jgi:hypothetical protein
MCIHIYGRRSLGAWRVLSIGIYYYYYYYQLEGIQTRNWNFYKYRMTQLMFSIPFMYLDHNAKREVKNCEYKEG